MASTLGRFLLLMTFLLLALHLPIGVGGSTSLRSSNAHGNGNDSIDDAINMLLSLGVPPENLCTVYQDSNDFTTSLPPCESHSRATVATVATAVASASASAAESSFDWNSLVRSRRQRYLGETQEENEEEEEGEPGEGDVWFLVFHALCALACVTVAALAAGLTMGLLSLDPLLLLIRVRAGSTEEEKRQAATILPIVKQHHLLLVTLLLLNSIANEALPLFLEVLVSPLVAVILSVTLVLFGGEIIPSAIFTGPNKIKLASQMIPVVKFVMFVLWPIAFPIAKILDHLLHHDEEDAAFNRGELSALVRIQYEERLATKQQHKEELAKMRKSHRLDPSFSLSSQRRISDNYFDATASLGSALQAEEHVVSEPPHTKSLHNDEIVMVEGALQMKTKCAIDVYTPMRQMYAVPHTTELSEDAVVDIYSSGFSRIPVFESNPQKPKQKTAIRGVLMTKQLIVVNSNDCRRVDTLPLYQPMCVSPKLNLVDLLNRFQTGKSGHLALVCARPDVAEASLMSEEPLSERAGFMGIVTIEDVLEELLQEEIADEFDKKEWKEERLSLWAVHKWKRFVQRRKMEREVAKRREAATLANVEEGGGNTNEATESTGLLGAKDEKKKKKTKKFLGLF